MYCRAAGVWSNHELPCWMKVEYLDVRLRKRYKVLYMLQGLSQLCTLRPGQLLSNATVVNWLSTLVV
jgi:hypothetical protein